MAHAPARTRDAHDLAGSKNPLIKIDSARAICNDQVRSYVRIAVGNGVHFRHESASIKISPSAAPGKYTYTPERFRFDQIVLRRILSPLGRNMTTKRPKP